MKRPGVALIEVIVAGLILAAGLGAIFSLTGASMGTQTEGANRIVAAWLADSLLGMVMTEGPARYARRNADEGVFDAPFNAYEYEIRILDQGERDPFQVTATVRWGPGPTDLVRIQTLVATRRDPLWLETYIDLLNVVRGRNPEAIDYNYDYTESTFIRGLPFIPSVGLRAEYAF